MKLKLNRKWFTEKSTIGILYIEDKFFCYTLEDVVRPSGEKVLGRTAIPWGTYRVVISFSNRFQKETPILLNVPMFEAIRIHSGNTAEDTEGCILVGSTHTNNFVGGSKVVMGTLMGKIRDAISSGEEVTIEIGAEATT